MHWHIIRFGLLMGLVGVLIAPPASGQSLSTGPVELEKQIKGTNTTRRDLLSGNLGFDKNNKDHQLAVQHLAQLFVYPVHWVSRDHTAGVAKRGSLNQVLISFEKDLLLSQTRTRALALQPSLYREVTDRILEVTEGKGSKFLPIAGVNATRMLSMVVERRVSDKGPVSEKDWVAEVAPRVADGTAEHIAEACLKVLAADNCNDGMRYYIYRCMASLVSFPPQTPPLLKTETRDRLLEAAVRQIEPPVKVEFAKNTPRGEIEGYKMLRLQAVRVLAGAAVASTPKEKPALVLARVAGGHAGIQPPPRVEERIEAAAGLARLGPVAAMVPDLQIDQVAYQVGKGVEEFGTKAADNLDSKPMLRREPWKVEASRLIEALDLLKEVKSPYVQELTKQCLAVLNPIESGARETPVSELTAWLDKNKPASPNVFKSDPKSLVTTTPLPKPDEDQPKDEKPKDKPKDEKPKDKKKDDKPKGK